MNYPYMPKSTALWLIENTSLTFKQIADFCGLHELEVNSIADAESHKMQGLDPVISGQLAIENLRECEADPSKRLILCEDVIETQKLQDKKGVGYTPMLHRKNRLGGVLWIIRNYPELSDTQIAKLMGSTKPTVSSIRNRTYRNYGEIHIQSPIVLGLISESALRQQLAKIKKSEA
jgi:hypothetical protein